MNIIKFCLLYLYKLIIYNPLKITFIIISLLTYRSAGNLPDEKVVINIIDSLHVNGEHQYLYLEPNYGTSFSTQKNDIKYAVYQSSEPTKVENGKITYYVDNDFNSVLWLFFAISTIVLIITLIIGTRDDDIGWNFDVVFSYALSWFIKCDISEDGKRYSFHAFGKLIKEASSGGYSARNISINISNIRDLKILPKYINKKEERDKLLNKILK